MNFLKNLSNKSWIDWVKIVVAIDIASAGLGLVIGLNLHIFVVIPGLLATWLGIIARVIFGIMYIFVAVLILKRVFPSELELDDNADIKKETIDDDIKEGVRESRRLTRHFIENAKKLVKKIEKYSDKMIDIIDRFLDKTEVFFKHKKKEVSKEIDNLLDK